MNERKFATKVPDNIGNKTFIVGFLFNKYAPLVKKE